MTTKTRTRTPATPPPIRVVFDGLLEGCGEGVNSAGMKTRFTSYCMASLRRAELTRAERETVLCLSPRASAFPNTAPYISTLAIARPRVTLKGALSRLF